MKAGFIGLGVMGYPMAGHLARAGHEVRVYNRTETKAQQWQGEYGGTAVASPAELGDCDIVFACVGRDEDVREVTLGEHGVFQTLKPGALFVDHTTTSAQLARELSAAASERGFAMLDAPVSGGQAGAENAALSIMVGGEQSAFAKAEPVMQAYGKRIERIGESGCGQLCKMVNQITITGLLQSLSEALNFGAQMDLDMEKVLSVISGGAAQSWQMENRSHTMLNGEYEFGFAVDLMRKDLGIVFAEAEGKDIDLTVAKLVDDYYAEVQNMGGGRWDTSSLFARLQNKTGRT